MWCSTSQRPPNSGYSFFSELNACGSQVTIRVTPTPLSVSTSVAASAWNTISLPRRRTHSPVDVSAAPRMPKRTPACRRIATNARAIRWPRGSNDAAEPT